MGRVFTQSGPKAAARDFLKRGPDKALSDSIYLLSILPGIFVGLLVFSRIGRLVQAFIKTDANSDKAQETSATLNRNQILGVFAFVTGWLGLFGALAYYVVTVRNGSVGWYWFFVGIAATPCIVFPPAIYFLQRGRNRCAMFDANKPSRGQSRKTYEYEITFDETYIRSLIDKHVRLDWPVGHPHALAFVFAVAAVVVWIFDVFEGNSFTFAVMVFAAGALSSFLFNRVQRKLLYSDYGYASHMGKTSTYRLSANGLEVEGPRPCHAAIWPDLIEWPNILAAARFRDGFFLYGIGAVAETGALAWLPDSALEDASPDDVARFIEQRMQPRTVKQLK